MNVGYVEVLEQHMNVVVLIFLQVNVIVMVM